MRGLVETCVLLAAGCGDIVEHSDPSVVHVAITQTWIDDEGTMLAVEPLPDVLAAEVVARIPNLDAEGGFDVRPAVMNGDEIVIHGIPPNATYFLDVTTFGPHLAFFTDVRDLNVTVYALGRPHPAEPTMPTRITMNVGNMDTWQDGDAINIHCTNVNAFARIDTEQPFAMGLPTLGAQQLALTVDWAQLDRGILEERMTPLIDGSMGDDLVITHTRRRPSSNGYIYDAVVETYAFPPFTQQDGAARTLDGAFTAPQAVNVHFNIKRDLFEEYLADIHPTAMLDPGFLGGGVVGVLAQPGSGDQNRLFSGAPSMLLTFFNSGPGDVDMGDMTFARPPANWGLWFGATHVFRVVRDTPLGVPHTTTGRIIVATPYTAQLSDIGPRISPPKSPAINGMSFYDPQTIAYRPTEPPLRVTWDAPALTAAEPMTYGLNIIRLSRNGDVLEEFPTATLYRSATEQTLAIPWEMFAGPGIYYMVLTVGSDAGERDPDVDDIGATDSSADTISGILTLE